LNGGYVSYECIGFDHQDGLIRITFNRPERLNAFNEAMHREVADALGWVEADTAARVLLITGAGRGFCAGQDLAERDVNAGPLDLGKATGEFYNPLVRRLATLAVPVVCAVNGVAAGAGVNIALACDIVLARQSAKFVQAFASIGLIPDAGGTWALPHLIGQARALGFTLLGDAITAETAERWGLIWRAIDDELFDAEVERIVRLLAQGPTRGLVLAKRAIREAPSSTLDRQLNVERNAQRECGLTEDYKEGVNAFKARRAPRFVGH
jgi:2-(1,2-epoxy-1,2-dihydrophenyl)acetyl-CoA isomerase